jgi:hypothetical protein
MEDNLSICNSISNPDKFFTDYNFGGVVNLWDSKCDGIVDEDDQYPNYSRLSIKTIYDPCPPGFKVPGCDVFGELDKLGSLWKNYGRRFGNHIFFPASGQRFHGSSNLHGGYGCYWSSAFSSPDAAYCLVFYAGAVYPDYSDCQVNGFSIRPVKE